MRAQPPFDRSCLSPYGLYRGTGSALAPLLIGPLIDPLGEGIVAVTAALSVSALVALMMLQ
jgi:hypothetical protein